MQENANLKWWTITNNEAITRWKQIQFSYKLSESNSNARNLSKNNLLKLEMLGNNLYALISIVVISGEDASTTGSTGAAQSTKVTWIREEDIPK